MDVLRSLACAGSAAVVTVTFVHPVDTVKTRMQVSGTEGARNYSSLGVTGTVSTVAREEGVAAFWKGINAAWLREASYTSLRLGLYSPIKTAMGADQPGAGALVKFAAGCLAGGIGSLVGNPFDVLKVKMMSAEGEALKLGATAKAVMAEQGLVGFYKGLDANIARAMVNNGTKMACYDVTKQYIRSLDVLSPNGAPITLASATVAGLFMTVTVAPFDMVRTRLMNQPTKGPALYKGFGDCLVKVVRAQGVGSLWSGFIPMWSRVAPTATLQLLLYDQFTQLSGGKTI